MAAGSWAPDSNEHYSSVRPAHSRQLKVAITSRWEIRELSNRLTRKGCENASMRERGRRRRSNQTLFCNGRDTVKVRQGRLKRTEDQQANQRKQMTEGYCQL